MFLAGTMCLVCRSELLARVVLRVLNFAKIVGDIKGNLSYYNVDVFKKCTQFTYYSIL